MSYPGVRAWLREHASLEPALLEGAGFDAHVGERLRASHAPTEDAYLDLLESDPAEVDRLSRGIAVPETWFFRYAGSFALLVEFLRARLESGAGRVRMCSIGCASGEEPYSMAIAALHAGWAPDAVAIDAFDRSPAALDRARAGEYAAFSLRSEIPAWGADYLTRHGETIKVDRALRGIVGFVHGDALAPGMLEAGREYDAVFCRNVLIYLHGAARQRLLRTIFAVLAPDGLLFVGHAEVPLLAGSQLRPIDAPHTFALRRSTDQPIAAAPAAPRAVPAHMLGSAAPVQLPEPGPHPTSAPLTRPTWDDALSLADAGRSIEAESLLRALLARHGPTAAGLELLGMIRLGRNDMAEAKRCFEKAVYLDPKRVGALLQLGIVLERQGDAERARMFRERARRASGRLGERAP